MIGEGSRLGPYEVVSRIGAGGMGEVWKAKDTRLDRSVAVKILPAEFASNVQLKLRFEREAKTISQLNHPNICTLHDVGNEGGTDYLVMELVQGESFAERLARGQLPLPEVTRYGAQIADALDRAHRAGVVHRDLKPANVMITPNGAKLLDFGLAKTAASVLSTSAVAATELRAADPTAGRAEDPLTTQGTILGTFQYMAPEQLEGVEADARSDIFALGALLYEMVTGKRAFEGKTRTSLIAAIVDRDPPAITSLRPLAPPALERVIRTCLAKNPDDRWQSAHDIAAELRWIGEAGSEAGVAAPVIIRRKHRELAAQALAVTALAAAAFLGYEVYKEKTRTVEPIHAAILPPNRVQFDWTAGPMALSPDGRRLAFVAPTGTGENALWVRPVRSSTAQALPGTSGAAYPFWSPDSKQVAFFADGKLKRIDSGGGPPQTITEAANGRGGAWNGGNVIIFAIVRDGLYSVPASGGTASKITTLDAASGEADHRWPVFLPGGKQFLYLARAEDPEESSVWVGTLGQPERKRIVQSSGNVAYANGYLLYTRERTLLAQKFDVKKLEFSGDPVPLAEQLTYTVGTAASVYSVSDTGLLVYAQGSSRAQLAWYDENGREVGKIGGPGEYGGATLSRDGARVAVDVASGGKFDIWIHDLNRATATRFTLKSHHEYAPVWSPDGSQIAYASAAQPPGIELAVKSTASGAEEVLWGGDDSQRTPADWSQDGQFLLVGVHNPKKKVVNDVWLYSIAERKATQLVSGPFSEFPGSFSPDGAWFVYTSNESGRSEVYAQAIGRAGKWQISTSGGNQPTWSQMGTEIFYIAPDRKLMAVPVTAKDTLVAGDPKPLFEVRGAYDVGADGKRFLVMTATDDALTVPVTMVSNWPVLATR
jgi:eukaryotic-like serine/threonine-protein kinase